MNSRVTDTIQYAYNKFLRNRLPRKVVVCNGIAARKGRLLDLTDEHPQAKDHLVTPVREFVRAGDTALEIGGGWGVTTAALSRQVGPEGRVICHEASPEMAERVRETLELNKLGENVTIREAVVETDIDVWGHGSTEYLPASELPDCDVLVMDCEGAERQILREMEVEPRLIVVETHEQFGSPTADIENILEANSYRITKKRETAGSYDRHGLTAVSD